jgi:hypothetical protein
MEDEIIHFMSKRTDNGVFYSHFLKLYFTDSYRYLASLEKEYNGLDSENKKIAMLDLSSDIEFNLRELYIKYGMNPTREVIMKVSVCMRGVLN